MGDEDSKDRLVCLKYDIALFTFEQLQTAVDKFTEYTKRKLASSYMMKEDFILELPAWDMPSIGDFEVVILEKIIEIAEEDLK